MTWRFLDLRTSSLSPENVNICLFQKGVFKHGQKLKFIFII